MTEREKMVAGQYYDPQDEELMRLRHQARMQMKTLEEMPYEKREEKRTLYREWFGSVGKNLTIEMPFCCDYGVNIHWGDDVFVNFDCIILDAAPVYIGDRVMIAPAVRILTSDHPLEASARNAGTEFASSIRIGENVWIGGGVIINPGVTIGANTVVGSGSVVIRDLPPNVVAVGNPTRIVKTLKDN